LFGRGVEYLLFFFLAYDMSQRDFGEFEFYKKVLEFGSVFAAFGTNSLILTYTRGIQVKVNFLIFSCLLSLGIVLMVSPLLYGYGYLFLAIPLIYFAQFHHANSIIQAFGLVTYGSKNNAFYKIIVAFIFSAFTLFFYFSITEKSKALVYASYPLYGMGIMYLLFVLRRHWQFDGILKIKTFFKLFIGQLGNMAALIAGNISNVAFLVTDIFVIRYMAKSEDLALVEVAIYSFALTIASLIIIIPNTILSVDLEKMKYNLDAFDAAKQKIVKLNLIIIPIVFIGYALGVTYIYTNYNGTLMLFGLILVSKFLQILGMPYGTYLSIKRKYVLNFSINLSVMLFNIVLSIALYLYLNLLGIAIGSLVSLLIRFLLFKKYFKKL
jgi:O-antigen/teichoic acid export membrane protein